MARIKPKQIDMPINTVKRVNSAFTILTGTGAYTTTAQFGGSVGGGNDTTVGVWTTSPNNRCELSLRLTGKEVTNAAGNRLFARTTFAASVFTTTLFVTDGAGGETAYVPVGGDNLHNVVVDMKYNEVVQIGALLPSQMANALDGIDESSSDPNSHVKTFDAFNAPAVNQTAFVLSFTPKSAAAVDMRVNGHPQIPTTDFTVAAGTVTFLAADFSIATTDKVTIFYDK